MDYVVAELFYSLAWNTEGVNESTDFSFYVIRQELDGIDFQQLGPAVVTVNKRQLHKGRNKTTLFGMASFLSYASLQDPQI